MAETVNDIIRSLEIRHTVGLQRLSTSIVRKIAKLLTEAEADIIAQLLKREATLAGTFTSKRLEYLLKAVREINHDAFVILGQELRGELRAVAKYEAQFQADLFRKTLPVAMDIVTPSAEMLQAVVTSRPLQGRFLRDLVKDLEVGRYKALAGAIRLGMVEGESNEQIIRRVRGTKAANYKDGILERSKASVERIVRTATNHVANAAREELYKVNDDLVKEVQWVATLDTRTCPACAALDGKTFEMGTGPRPPQHISCRCATAPVVASWRSLGIDLDEAPEGTRASMDGQVSATETYSTWLGKQSAEVQDDALGPTRGALFRRGDVTVDRFTNRAGDAWTLDELRKREAEGFAKANL